MLVAGNNNVCYCNYCSYNYRISISIIVSVFVIIISNIVFVIIILSLLLITWSAITDGFSYIGNLISGPPSRRGNPAQMLQSHVTITF